MVSTIRIGPEGGPYVKVEENNGTLDITTPNDTVDLQSNELVNAALGGIMNANGNDITNVNQLDANSVNTDEQLIGSTDFLPGSETLADDTATSFSPSTAGLLIINGQFGGAIGSFVFSFGTLNTAAVGNNITNQGTETVLTGTTGSDGDINVSTDSGDVYIENRTGLQQTVTYILVG